MITYDFSESGLRSALEALGTTPEAVAKNLDGLGIRGKRGEECNCPLANYLVQSVKGAVRAFVYVDEGEVYCLVNDTIGSELRPIVGSPGTGAIDRFVERFDAGFFPTLDLEATDASS